MYPLKYLSAHPVIAPSKQIALFVLHGYRVKAEPQKIEASVRVTTLSEGYVPVTVAWDVQPLPGDSVRAVSSLHSAPVGAANRNS